MRPISLLLAAIFGLVLGIASTWFLLHRVPDDMKSTTSAAADKKVLYWYDPMVPNQHFDQPGKSPFMDMALVPKYADDTGHEAGIVQIDPGQVQNLGLRTARVERGVLTPTVHATGTIAFDERAVSVVQARVAGIVEQLAVRAPLTAVKQGQPLLTVLAPDWTAAQEEYLALQRTQSKGLDELRTAARQRLLLLGMSEAQIKKIERSGQAEAQITIIAPRTGVIGELAVREGATVMAGTPLLRINGLETVWVNAAIPEAQIGHVAPGALVEVELPAFPGEHFSGQIEALLPDIDAATRTQIARIVLPNPHHRLAPGMFAEVKITSTNSAESVLVPSEAVIATGTRTVVIVVEDTGRFRAQEVRLGAEADGKSEVREGLTEDDTVVLSGQFLIDSEASLAGTLARLDISEANKDRPSKATPTTSEPAHDLHRATGRIERIDGDRCTIATEAIPSLDMGAMTMTFVCPAQVLTEGVRPGQRVDFSFFRNNDDEFEIDSMRAINTPRNAP